MVWLFLLIPTLLLIPSLGDFLFRPGSAYSDLLISHFPNALFLQQTILNWHVVPLWSPTIMSGYPFAADPLSGLWYPPGWLTVIIPTALGFNLCFMLHLVLGGYGLYRFLCLEGLSALAAVFGGVLFEFMPKIWAHFAAGHVTLNYALAWTPWLLLAEKVSNHRKPGQLSVPPGVIWGIILLADVRWGALAGLIWMVYRIWQRTPWIASPKNPSTSHSINTLPIQLGRFFFFTAAQILLGISIAAPLLLPLIQYTQLSTRSLLTPIEAFTLSLPADRLLGLLYPDPNGPTEWTLYLSQLGLILLIFAFFWPPVRQKVKFWLALFTVSLFFSLGSTIPFLVNLAKLPGFDLLRVPPRALFICGISLAIIGAVAFEELISSRRLQTFPLRLRPELTLSGVAELSILFAGIVWFLKGSLSFNFLWGAVWSVFAAALVILRLRNVISAQLFAVFGLLFLIIDLGVVDRLSFEPRSPASVFSASSNTVDYLASRGGEYRVYSPSYSIPQYAAAAKDLSLADGIDPLQLQTYVEYMQKATGVPSAGYSVTLPPFATGTPANDNRGYQPDLKLLGLLNVSYLAADYEIHQSGLNLLTSFGDTRIYANQSSLPRAWVQDASRPVGVGIQPVEIIPSDPNVVRTKASGPGLLVLSEINYPGWEAWVDGVQKPVETVLGIFRAVQLESGSHQILFVFKPILVYLGIFFSLLSWVGVGVVSIRSRRFVQ